MEKVVETEKQRELRWQTERDFDTLMEYQKLIKEPERLKRAKKLEGYSGYVEEHIYRSMGARYGTWSDRQNKKLYEELRKIK